MKCLWGSKVLKICLLSTMCFFAKNKQSTASVCQCLEYNQILNIVRINYMYIVMEADSDPGIIILWKPRLLHTALGQAGAPVAQGPDEISSLERMEQYIYTTLL